MEQAIGHVERRLRARLRQLPDGVWREVQFLDHDGHRMNMRRIVCTVTKQHDRLTVDFTGSDPQVDGFANCAIGGLRAAVMSGVSIMLGYDLPWNDGIARCVDIVAPRRTIVTAESPTPVSMSTISAIIVTLNATFGALSRMLLASPQHHQEVMANWCGTSLGVSVIGVNEDGIMSVCAEASHFAAGCGARIDEDGVDTGGIIINTTANIPSIEATEAEYPVLYLFRRQMCDSGGAGTQRGGVAGEVAMIPYGIDHDLETSFAGVGVESPNGYGLAGGLPGATVRYVRFRSTGVADAVRAGDSLPSSFSELVETSGDFVYDINVSHTVFPLGGVDYHNWQGGGGYGDPLDRNAQRVADDVRAQVVSQEAARTLYGVVLNEGQPDAEATTSERHRRRLHRLEVGRPARTVLSDVADIPDPANASDIVEGKELRYGDLVEWDLASGLARCVRCKQDLGPGGEDFRLGCLVEESATGEAGPVRGQDYDTGQLVLRRFYCPGCGRQLEAEIAMRSGPRAGFRLAMPG
jgi:N-methylhydantoinase B